jgi:hypothetical protein
MNTVVSMYTIKSLFTSKMSCSLSSDQLPHELSGESCMIVCEGTHVVPDEIPQPLTQEKVKRVATERWHHYKRE